MQNRLILIALALSVAHGQELRRADTVTFPLAPTPTAPFPEVLDAYSTYADKLRTAHFWQSSISQASPSFRRGGCEEGLFVSGGQLCFRSQKQCRSVQSLSVHHANFSGPNGWAASPGACPTCIPSGFNSAFPTNLPGFSGLPGLSPTDIPGFGNLPVCQGDQAQGQQTVNPPAGTGTSPATTQGTGKPNSASTVGPRLMVALAGAALIQAVA
ncbi:hypothetical protein B0H13DRAFT_1918680 [Mycena leptocephala]|nr:hypothetical protein B0H13DRAFT_1918680 [Mycena leptocephala]